MCLFMSVMTITKKQNHSFALLLIITVAGATNVLGTGALIKVIAAAAGQPQRFYRVRFN